MKTLHSLRTWACLLATAAATSVQAGPPSDIDIFSGANANNGLPNVLLVLDSSANWDPKPKPETECFFQEGGVNVGQPTDPTSKYGIEMCAMHNVVDQLPTGPNGEALFNVGLMLTNASPDSNKGGFPYVAFTPLDATGKTLIKNAIRLIANTPTYKANLAQISLMLHESYLYFKGERPRTGDINAFYDRKAFVGGRYRSPSGNSCGRNYVILIDNGAPTAGENGPSQALLKGLGGSAAATTIPDLTQGVNEANYGDEYARFMRQADVSGKEDQQGIITHAVAVIDPSQDNVPSEQRFRAYARSVAKWGGGNYYEASKVDQLVKSLRDIFDQIQAVNSVFASASLPVSVNARGTYLNQVYMGMFRPDGEGKPRWVGNLKQYQFTLDPTGDLYLTDAAGQSAINPSTGFFKPSAVSFWTAASTFWTNQPMGTPPSANDLPDGEIVEKGSVAQRLRTQYAKSQAERNVYTCLGCTTSPVALGSDTTLFRADKLAVVTGLAEPERTALIDWVRGAANASDELGPTTDPATTVRPSIHGDVLHSGPAVVNYGGSVGVVVYYGSNDGQLRAINGNKSATGANGVEAGGEYWSFIAEEFFPKLKRLRDNKPTVELSTTLPGLDTAPRDYFFDGPITVYQKVDSGGTPSRVILYVGMRRGGRTLYAFDVTEPTKPMFLWKVSNGTVGMELLGQTWSEARLAKIRGWNNADTPVIILGGGYHADAEDYSGAGTAMGNAVYVLDAFTGQLLKAFTTLTDGTAIGRSIAAAVTPVDSDSDGIIDRAYAVDLGGQVFRIDFESSTGAATPADWTIYKLADLSGGTTTGRKFFFAPDAIVTKRFTALMFGSGDREKPLLTSTEDHFFQIFDRRSDKGAPSTPTPMTFASLKPMGATSSTTGDGCYMSLAVGEKVVNAATSIGGYSFFGTNRPSASFSTGTTCSANLGVAKSYSMPLFCIASPGALLSGGGLPPSPVAGIVQVTRDGKEVQVPFVIGAPNPRASAIEGSRVRPTVDSPRRRRYWFQETQR
jgi:type IV pilus assembly protein PilY1